MEVALCLVSRRDPTFLQQIPVNVRAGDCAVPCEAYPNKLAKTAGVIVTLSLRVTESFQDRIGLQYLAFQQAQRGRFRK